MIDIENYDENNIFAKILKKEVPSHKVYEDEYLFLFFMLIQEKWDEVDAKYCSSQ